MRNASFIEKRFPIEFLSDIAKKEAHALNKKPIYRIHTWWGRRLGSIFRAIITGCLLPDTLSAEDFKELFYGKPKPEAFQGKIILDPLAGGGTTLIEGARLGCRIIGVDINPVAWFIMKKELDPVSTDMLEVEFGDLERRVGPEIKKYYFTKCSKCGRKAEVVYTFWVKKIGCLECGSEVLLYPRFKLASFKRKSSVTFLTFCPTCLNIFSVEKEVANCPRCNNTFALRKGYARNGIYFCPNCKNEGKIIEALNGQAPEMEMIIVEYYCPHCKERWYKPPDELDFKLYEKACREFRVRKDRLLFPKQKIPHGVEIRKPLKHGYRYFFEFFNERQLLCLSVLFEEILKIKDSNIKEFMLLAFSKCLDYNNIFCRYDTSTRTARNLFALHTYWPPCMPIENNLWGSKSGSFKRIFGQLMEGLNYRENPYELLITPSGKSQKIRVQDFLRAKFVNSFDELATGHGNILLRCQTAEDLSFIPDKSVDIVVTDPPYYDNVQYAELADFFYVWLQLGLQDRYNCFKAEYSPREGEMVKNRILGKGTEAFFEILRRVLKECNRTLKDNGLLVFTFHHNEKDAWTTVKRALFDSGFYVVATHPVRSEMEVSTHIRNVRAIEYDVVVVCKKATHKKSISWDTFSFSNESYSRTKEVVERLMPRRLKKVDVITIEFGKNLELSWEGSNSNLSFPDIIKKLVKSVMQLLKN